MKEETVYRESRLRSILKAGTWRFVATGTTLSIAYIVTGKTEVAVTIAGIEVFTKMIIYYFHERAWQMLPRGSIRKLIKQKRQARRKA